MSSQPDFSASAPPEGQPTALDAEQVGAAALQAVLGELEPDAALMALATSLAQGLGCRRVAAGWITRGHWRVRGLSHGAQLGRQARLDVLLEAMQEAGAQGQSLCVPQVADGAVHIVLAHRALMRSEGVGAVLTVPLAHRGQVLGALTLEREVGRFTAAELLAVEGVAERVTPVLQLQHRAALSAGARWVQARREQWADQGRGGRMVWRAGLALGMLLVALTLTVPVPHQVPTAARVEGAHQRVLTAPVDGYLREVMARPGDVVRHGQVLALLADEDLKLQARGFQADLAQHENAFVDAFTRGERAEAAMAQARALEARAQLERVEQQLLRTRIVAPFDGVVISGDVSQQVGAPLKRSDVLFTMAPLEGWRVVLDVDERQIAQVRAGQEARLLLAALPQSPMRLRIERVTPLARPVEGRQRFEVLAQPVGTAPAGWRPGMQGVAQIELPSEALGLRWARDAWRTVRWWTWSWW